MGEIEDLNEGLRGPTPHLYRAIDGRIEPDKRETAPPAICKEDYDLSKAVWIVHARVVEAIAHIRADDDAWRKPRRIQKICEDRVKPAVQGVISLWRAGFKVTPPWEFFQNQGCAPAQKLYRDLEVEGTLGVRSPNSSEPDTWIYPGLLEWDRYFRKVLDELAGTFIAHSRLVITDMKTKDGQSERHHGNWQSLRRDGVV